MGDACSGRAGDVWALGATLFHLLAGRIPFGEEGMPVMSVYDAIPDDPLDMPPSVRLSGACEELLRGMLEKDPARRLTLVLEGVAGGCGCSFGGVREMVDVCWLRVVPWSCMDDVVLR